MKIISIDDELWSSDLLKMMIQRIKSNNPDFKDIEFTGSFTNVTDAIDYLKKHKTDLIFLDIEMPEMNGLAFANHLEELHIDSKIVFLTAYSRYALEAWRTSAIDYILKPFDQSQLERALSRALPDIPNISAQKALFLRCFPKF